MGKGHFLIENGERTFPNAFNVERLCSEFASYFFGKVTTIRDVFNCRIVEDNSDVNVSNTVQLVQLGQTTDGEDH